MVGILPSSTVLSPLAHVGMVQQAPSAAPSSKTFTQEQLRSCEPHYQVTSPQPSQDGRLSCQGHFYRTEKNLQEITQQMPKCEGLEMTGMPEQEAGAH